MSDSPVYWSQPNQQVVRDGDPVGIMDSGPDPQAKTEPEPEQEQSESKRPRRGGKSHEDDTED
jgi:hypothetical protein